MFDINSYIKLKKENVDSFNDLPILEKALKIHKYAQELQETQAELANKLADDFYIFSSIYISPLAIIDENLSLLGGNIFIGENTQIGKNCVINSGTSIGKKNQNYKIIIGDNVEIGENVKIRGNINIGNNVSISPSCIVIETVPENYKVNVVNQIQYSEKSSANNIPSQRLIFYGVYPKFKNTFIIMGEGFYNPTVLIKTKQSQINYSSSYWDKNKIIIKIKNTSPLSREEARNTKLILLCRNNKIVILHSIGLEKALLSITN